MSPISPAEQDKPTDTSAMVIYMMPVIACAALPQLHSSGSEFFKGRRTNFFAPFLDLRPNVVPNLANRL